MLNRNAIFTGGIRPHYYCLPVLKRERHRLALRRAATSGASQILPRHRSARRTCARQGGGLRLRGHLQRTGRAQSYLTVFEEENALDRFEAFASLNGPRFYGLPPNPGTITLAGCRVPRCPETSRSPDGGALRPFLGGPVRSRGRWPARPAIESTPFTEEQAMSKMRIEHDLLGDREVPDEAYYGVHTLRAMENFPITGHRPSRPFRNWSSRWPGSSRRLPRPTPSSASCRRAARCDRRRLQGNARRRAARAVRGRRDPGRRRHLDQHERQRGDRATARWRSWATRRATTAPASQRARQHGQSTNDVYPTALKHRRLLRHRAAARGHGARCARAFDAKAEEFARRAEDGPHPAAGRGADDAGPGVLDLCGHARGRRAAR